MPHIHVTLSGINRRGDAWKARDWWRRQKVRIWSAEHCAWWRDNGSGYTVKMTEAGIYTFPDAYDRTKHCGPEKGIRYYAVKPMKREQWFPGKHVEGVQEVVHDPGDGSTQSNGYGMLRATIVRSGDWIVTNDDGSQIVEKGGQ